MVFRMKTTLIIPDPVFRRFETACRKARHDHVGAGRRTAAQRAGRAPETVPASLRCPASMAGRILVDVADRDALYDVLDAERDARLYGSSRKKD